MLATRSVPLASASSTRHSIRVNLIAVSLLVNNRVAGLSTQIFGSGMISENTFSSSVQLHMLSTNCCAQLFVFVLMWFCCFFSSVSPWIFLDNAPLSGS